VKNKKYLCTSILFFIAFIGGKRSSRKGHTNCRNVWI